MSLEVVAWHVLALLYNPWTGPFARWDHTPWPLASLLIVGDGLPRPPDQLRTRMLCPRLPPQIAAHETPDTRHVGFVGGLRAGMPTGREGEDLLCRGEVLAPVPVPAHRVAPSDGMPTMMV